MLSCKLLQTTADDLTSPKQAIYNLQKKLIDNLKICMAMKATFLTLQDNYWACDIQDGYFYDIHKTRDVIVLNDVTISIFFEDEVLASISLFLYIL